ncbi:MAG: PAS domain S-box protein [Acidobacteria bacterium]|nr:PAS domain S-box protein [Acidobacteriota bacterium]
MEDVLKQRLRTVRVPPQFEAIFRKAQENVGRYFQDKREDATHGTIEVFGQRYILVRAASMSVEFFESLKKLYADRGEAEALSLARNLLFDLSHAIGAADAKNFHKRLHLEDPLEKLSAGPVHFAYAGWAFVDILPESNPCPGEKFLLIYDHPYSFEAHAWISAGKRSPSPVCVMNAGYSSGWCEESFGTTLVATEVLCRARGDDRCRFIMAPPESLEQAILEQSEKLYPGAGRVRCHEIPGIFSRLKDKEERQKLELQHQVEERKHVEEELRLERDFSAAIIQDMPVIICGIAPDGTTTFINPAGERITGYSSAELIGRNWWEALYPGEEHRQVEQLFRDFEQGDVREYEMTLIAKGGSRRVVSWNSINRYDASGVIREVIGVGNDITERKQSEQALTKSEKLYRTIFENATDGIFQTTWEGRLLTANPAMARIFGYDSPGEMIASLSNRLFTLYVDPEKRREYLRLLEGNGFIKNFEYKAYRKDGSIIHVSENTHVIRGEDGKVSHYEGIIEDVTEKKRIDELKAEKETADAANRAKSEFLSCMSHELRTPLTSIVGFANIVHRKVEKVILPNLPAENEKARTAAKQIRENAEIIMFESRRMTKLISDLLDLSKIEAGKKEWKRLPVSVPDIIDQALMVTRPLFKQNGLEVAAEVEAGLPAVMGDEDGLIQVLINLVSNSVKFTERGGTIFIGARRCKGCARWGEEGPGAAASQGVLVTVRDTGVGIPADKQGEVFEKFRQVGETLDSIIRGTGLGLYICRQIVEIHGGRIGVTSEGPGKGSCFFFTVPSDRAEPKENS